MPDPVSDMTLARIRTIAAERVTRINETTRDAIRGAIVQGVDLGEGAAQLGARISEAASLSPYRGELIARTETMHAWNASALGTYADEGVTLVEAEDGDEDAECQERQTRDNGYGPGIYTLEEAMAEEDHPNGTLAWSPVISAEEIAQLRQDVQDAGLGEEPSADVLDLGSSTDAQKSWEAENYGPEWREQLTPGQAGTLANYTGDRGYAEANSYLRGYYNPPPEVGLFETKMSKPGLDKYIGRIDDALELHPLPADMKLYRSLSIDWTEETSPVTALFGSPAGGNAGLVGRSAIDPGFLSASLRADIAERIEGEYLMELIVPRGTPGAALSSLSKNPGEREVLLGRGLRLTIESVTERGRTTVLGVRVSAP